MLRFIDADSLSRQINRHHKTFLEYIENLILEWRTFYQFKIPYNSIHRINIFTVLWILVAHFKATILSNQSSTWERKETVTPNLLNFIYIHVYIKVKLATIYDDDPKAPLLIATTPSATPFPGCSIYPWSAPYNVVC